MKSPQPKARLTSPATSVPSARLAHRHSCVAMLLAVVVAAGGCASRPASTTAESRTRPPATAPAASSAPAASAPATAPASAPAATAAAAQRYDFDSDIFHPIEASRGMVATEERLATQVGLNILKRGGNAVDAAVAVGFALAVTLPNAGNIGGGGFMLVHDAKTSRTVALDFREVAPGRATRDMYLDDKGNVAEGRSLTTHLAVGVPGTVAGLEHALGRYGTMKLGEVLAPAIALAERGYRVSPSLAKLLSVEQKNLERTEPSRVIFLPRGKPLQAGELLVQKDLAASLKRIARGAPAPSTMGRSARPSWPRCAATAA